MGAGLGSAPLLCPVQPMRVQCNQGYLKCSGCSSSAASCRSSERREHPTCFVLL